MSRTCLDLFAGGGLASEGLRQAGFSIAAAVESDPLIAEAYSLNHDARHLLVQRVEDVDYRPYAGVDHLHASPVCVNASVANQAGEESEQDRAAAAAIVRALEECRPQTFSLENVWQYRKFDSFRAIRMGLARLGYKWTVQHCNAADVGVPQTRKRLILQARLGGEIPDPLPRTHCEGGSVGLFAEHDLLPWNGWYVVIEDLLPGLPESRLADWQMARLPQEWKTMLVTNQHDQNWNREDRGPRCYEADEPSGPVIASATGGRTHAVLVDGVNGHADGEPIHRLAADPARCVQANAGHRPGNIPRAVLVSGVGTGDKHERAPQLAGMDEPSFVHSGKGRPSALLIGGANTSAEQAGPGVGCSAGDEPSRLVAPNSDRRRAILPGVRVVKLSPRCLARFQSCPDTFRLPEKTTLACRILGNGKPPRLMLAVMRSLWG